MPSQEPEVGFEDGSMTSVVRVGATVRRGAGPWTPAVHALLHHLEAAGFEGAPRVRGLDEQGREVLGYIEGRSGPASLEGFRSDEVLIAVAQLVRRYHDATAGFQPPADAAWQVQVGAPATGEVICHNDLAPFNTIFAGDRPTAFVDWDFAAPGPRVWDIAYALWVYVPLYADERFDPPPERARRMRLVCDAYGLADRCGVLHAVERRQRVLYDTFAGWAQEGRPWYVERWRRGRGDGIMNDIVYLRRHRAVFEAALRGNA